MNSFLTDAHRIASYLDERRSIGTRPVKRSQIALVLNISPTRVTECLRTLRRLGRATCTTGTWT